MDDGLKTLFALYKSPIRVEGDISEDEMDIAKEQGYLFDYPAYETHSNMLQRLRSILEQIDSKDIANAFLFSLSTRRLEYRSAIGSYYYAMAIPEHEFMKSHNEILAAASIHCYFCGWSAWKDVPNKFDEKYGYNFKNYERYKYGGSVIGDINLNYAIFDLEQFIKLPKVTPVDEDKQIFAKILSCVECLKNSDKVGKLRDVIRKAKIFKTNKDEISVLLGELGICGILASNQFPAYDVYFANEYERDPVEYKNDFAYPVNRWYARDGINCKRLIEVFGEPFCDYK
jgi:hypothetical protein